MIKSFVVAASLTISLASYAWAQDTVTGAPAGTAPMKPEPIPMMMHHHHHYHPHHPSHRPLHHNMGAPRATPTDTPK